MAEALSGVGKGAMNGRNRRVRNKHSCLDCDGSWNLIILRMVVLAFYAMVGWISTALYFFLIFVS